MFKKQYNNYNEIKQYYKEFTTYENGTPSTVRMLDLIKGDRFNVGIVAINERLNVFKVPCETDITNAEDDINNSIKHYQKELKKVLK